MLQDALAASDPPLNEIVCGAVVDNVPPHCAEEVVETVSPLGSVSVKLIPLKATAVFGLVRVNVSVEVAPAATGLGEKDFVNVGEEGAPQPVNVTLSRLRSAPLLGVFAPIP
jgi:hypothetical protein